jgi:hypothetical protein
MSAELNAISNIMAGVKKTTGKGQAGMSKISKSYRGAVKKKAASKAREEKAKSKASSSKKGSTTQGPSVARTKEDVAAYDKRKQNKANVGAPKTNKGSINLEEPAFTPKPKTKVTQPSLPGMSKAKLKKL